jgi:hypothetical protein
MVDKSDFVVAYVPTNVYSVGTPHEIILCLDQRKPVLFVSPPVVFPTLEQLRDYLTQRTDTDALRMLDQLEAEVPIKLNRKGAPSLWYLPLIGGEHFFDGFGFAQYRDLFGWEPGPMDQREERCPPQKPVLKFLEDLNRELPKKWDRRQQQLVQNDDWLLLDLDRETSGEGAEVKAVYEDRKDLPSS